MNEINQMSSEDNVEETPVMDGAGALVPETRSALLPADQNRQELITADEAANIDKWVVTIEAAWGKTVQAVINLGSLLNQAKAELGVSYKELEKRLSIDSSLISIYTRIANNTVLSNPNNYPKLPSGYNILYQLTQLDDQVVEDKINSGDINPKLTLSKAKSLRTQIEEQSSNTAKDQPVRSYDVGKIKINDIDRLQQFKEDLDQLIEKYQGTISYSTNDKSIVEYYRESLHAQAMEQVQTLGSAIIRTITLLEEVILYLQNKHTPKAKGTEGRNKYDSHKAQFLPPDHPSFTKISNLLNTKDIDLIFIKEWSKQEKIPNLMISASEIDSDVYVWYLVQQITDKNPNRMAKKRLEDIASKSTAENIKELAQSQLTAISRFEDNQGKENAKT